MEGLASAIMNGAVVVFLWGLLWRTQHQRIDLIQSSVEKKVELGYCEERSRNMHQDLLEMKTIQERMAEALEEIRVSLARENGRRSAFTDAI